MSRGWRGEPRRHALAARGIPCRANAVFRPYRLTGPINYDNNKEWIFAFWKASLEDDWDDFDFNKVFEQAKNEMEMWGYVSLAEPGAVMDTDYYEYGKSKGLDLPRWRTEEASAFIEENFEKIREHSIEKGLVFWPESWGEVWNQVNNPPMSRSEKIALVDRIIHMQHSNGYLLRDTEGGHIEDMSILRKEFDRIYGRPMG